MIPIHRAGLGAWLGSPIGGCMLLLRVRGRKSGIVRETPLNYLVADGSVWIVAGFGPATEWYRNLLADPAVEVVLPGAPPGRYRRRGPLPRRPGPDPAGPDPGHRPAVVPGGRQPVDGDGGPDHRRAGLRAADPDRSRRRLAGPGPGRSRRPGWIWRQALVLGASLLVLRALRRLVR